MKRVRILVTTAAALLVATGASAQGAYAGASLFAEIVRSTHSESAGVRGEADGGEAVGFALRVGTRIGPAWGVELEFARPSLIEEEGGGPIALPALDPTLPLRAIAGLPERLSPAIFPPITLGIRTAQRHTTLSALAWAEQQVGARVSLVYLGGISFGRSQRDYTVTFSPLAGVPSLSIAPFTHGTVTYGVGPVAGFESRLALTDRAQLVPGIRLQTVDDAWLVRPSIGLSWMF